MSVELGPVRRVDHFGLECLEGALDQVRWPADEGRGHAAQLVQLVLVLRDALEPLRFLTQTGTFGLARHGVGVQLMQRLQRLDLSSKGGRLPFLVDLVDHQRADLFDGQRQDR